jgi:hypothetical protein
MTDLLQPSTTGTLLDWRLPASETPKTDGGSASLWPRQSAGEWACSISFRSGSSSEFPEHGTLPHIGPLESGSNTLPSCTSTIPLRSRHVEASKGCWKAVLADLLDQALTVDAFIEASRQAFGETCIVVPLGEGFAMQQVMPPQRIIIT